MARLGHRPVLRPAAAALFALLASCWFGMDWGGVHPTLFGDDLLQFVLPGAAAVSCAVAAVRARDRRRLTWWLVAASLVHPLLAGRYNPALGTLVTTGPSPVLLAARRPA